MSGMKDLFGDEPVPDDFGTEPRKLHRRDDPETSRAAAYKVNSKSLEFMVLQAIAGYRDGCIQADLLARFPYKPYSSITARFAALEEKGLITTGPDMRPGPSDSLQQVRRVTALGRSALL